MKPIGMKKDNCTLLWVALSTKTAVFHIGSRRKEELSHLVKEAFIGWLVTDGYRSYRSYPKRQRCLAHLIRKAVAITGAINQKAAQIGQWILDDLRELISTIANAGEKATPIRQVLARLTRACHLGKKADHEKLKALASEIFNDWDAIVAFVHNPELPPTNNEAERALRHAVIARQIGYGTRTREGSLAYSSLLSVIETCRLRQVNPWTYIASVIALARKGRSSPPTTSTYLNLDSHLTPVLLTLIFILSGPFSRPRSVLFEIAFLGGGCERLHLDNSFVEQWNQFVCWFGRFWVPRLYGGRNWHSLN